MMVRCNACAYIAMCCQKPRRTTAINTSYYHGSDNMMHWTMEYDELRLTIRRMNL